MFRILKLLNSSDNKKVVFIFALILILGLLELFIFSFFQLILNFFNNVSYLGNNILLNLFFSKDNITLVNSLYFFVCIYIVKCFLTVIISYKKSALEQKINEDLSTKLYEIYLNKNFQFFINNNSSNLISNITSEVDKFSYNVVGALIFCLTEIFLVTCIIFFLLSNYFYGTLIIIIFISILFYTIYKKYKKKLDVMGHQRLIQFAKRLEDLQRSFYIIQNVKLDHLENYFSEKFKKNNKLASDAQLFLQIASEVPKPIIELLSLFIVILIISIFYYHFHFSKQELVSMLGLYAIALFRLIPSANRILNSISMIRFHSSSTDLLLKEINNNENNQNTNPILFKYKNFSFQDKIILEDINFKYSDCDRLILKNVNLQIKKNEVIGISGNSGSGKSTLLNIICSLLKPTTGKIVVDNIPLEDIYKYYQSKIGYVSQKIYLMDDTFIQNITFGSNKSNYNYELFNNIIRKTNLEVVLENLSLKENTIVGERGSKLSGGQQQRMGIARALYKCPEILILDEATNALDDDSEKEILDMILSLRNKLTIIIVSHKKLVLDYCDKIYELRDGILKQEK